jgi:hypothetical protein
MANSQAKNNRIATIIAGIFFLLVAAALFYVTFSLRTEAQGRELHVSLADLTSGEVTYGDYLVIEDTGAVVSAASNIVDERGTPMGYAFLLNGITNYVFLVGLTDEFADTTGAVINSIGPGTMLPNAFYARVNTASDPGPFGAEDFAIRNGLSTGQQFFVVQTGVTRSDTTVPFYLTLAFGVLALIFSAGSWWGLAKKQQSAK